MTASEYKEFKGIRKENLRDNMSDMEVALTNLGEVATRELVKKYRSNGLESNMVVAKAGGEVAKAARENIEDKLKEPVITSNNNLNYKYLDDKSKYS